MKPNLKVFVTESCSGCDEALKIVMYLKQNYPSAITVELIDITAEPAKVPETVFATPTFMLNDKIVSLGNPGPNDVAEWVRDGSFLQPES